MSIVLSACLPLLSAAPGGVQKLRGLILELAVRGKLVPQDPDDEPAAELLNRVAEKQTQLAAVGAWKKTKPMALLGDDDQPFNLPANWKWVRFSDVTSYIQRGKGPDYANKSDAVVVSQKCVRWEGLDISQARWITPESLEKYDSIRLLRTGDVLWNSTGTGTIGRAVVVPDIEAEQILVADSHVTVVRCILVSPMYLWRWIQSPTVQTKIEGSASGSTNQIELATSTVTAHPLPLPPLAEQHRIVAKVDELMALCDQLEAEQADADSVLAKLVETLLGTLTQSLDAADFAANWERVAEHFDTLFTTESSFDILKQTILQLAVMGKLVPQVASDEPSSELLKRIEHERARLVTEGAIKKPKPTLPVGEHEYQHSIPASWNYVRLQDLCSVITDGTHQTPKYTNEGRPFLSAQNVKPFRFMPEVFRCVSEEDFQGYVKSTKPELGDVLLTRVGAMIGEAAVIDKKMDFAIYVSLALLKPIQPLVSSEYIVIWLNSPFGTHSSIRDTLGRGVSAGNLNLALIRAFSLPLPPIAEQHRIVCRVNELMALCDSAKATLSEARRRQERLASILIESALKAA
jgi:type I restriction enzyme S subunit